MKKLKWNTLILKPTSNRSCPAAPSWYVTTDETVTESMQLAPGETSLVVTGAWNPAILTPTWVLQHGLQRFEPEQVQVLMPAGFGGVFEFPRYVLDRFSYVVRPEALVLTPTQDNPESLVLMEDALQRILSALSYTPVNGVGHNFEFRQPEPSPKDLSVFGASRADLVDSLPDEWTSSASTIVSSFSNRSGTVFMNVQRIFDSRSIVTKFNFHHPITAVDQALQVLVGIESYRRMSSNLETAETLMRNVYGAG